MGYMGFGMRKEVYQRKPKKMSNNLIYSDSRLNIDNNLLITQIKKERLKYRPDTVPLGLKAFRIILYKIIPLTILAFIIYSVWMNAISES
jgi:hypothetical protein